MKIRNGTCSTGARALVLFLFMFLFAQYSFADDSSVAAGLFPFRAETIAFRAAPKVAGSRGFIRVVGDQFVDDDGPVRFWGVNLCMSANFPEKDVASAMAKRMADFGINVVRLHHMDLREIWGKNYPRQTELDPEKLARLDWLVHEFKQNGIYVDINLHVSKKMRAEDGFTDYDLRPQHDKGIDNYEPRLVELQKKYARDLLTHVNPYTKTAYRDEPAVAMIEINNENSIVAAYFWHALDKLDATVYTDPLRVRWNKWLKDKYGTTANLEQAWKRVRVPLGKEMIDDGSFAGSGLNAKWHVENNDGAVGKLSLADGAILFETVRNGTYGWEPQFYYRPISIKKEMPYTLVFRARAEKDGQTVEMSVYPTGSAMQKKLTLSKDWKEYRVTMPGSADVSEARIGFTYFTPGKYWFDDISFKPGGTLGLPDDESIEKGNIHLIKREKNGGNTELMRADFMRFLLELEDGYWQEMYRYVKDELKARAPVTGTQLHYGSAFAQAKLDYVDIHSYWNHPSFPGGAWDGNNWSVTNTALVNVLGTGGTLVKLGATRVLGRPYTVSEYNHPYPNLYGVEGFPMIAALAGFQEWSGIFTFGWAHNAYNGNTAGFFDIHGNPAILVHFPACRNMFVRGDVRSGLPTARYSNAASIFQFDREYECDAQCESANGNGDRKDNLLEAPRCNVFREYSGIRLSDLKIPEPRTASLPAFDLDTYMKRVRETIGACTSSTGELIWNAKTENKGYFLVDTERTKVFSGFVAGRAFEFKGGLKLVPGKSLLDWMTISVTEPETNRRLVAATGLIRNTGSKVRVYRKGDPELKKEELTDVPPEKMKDLLGEKITYCRSAGGGPVLVEGVSAKLVIPLPEGKSAFLCPLDENGRPVKKIAAKRLDAQKVEVETGPQYRTLWYEIVVEPTSK